MGKQTREVYTIEEHTDPVLASTQLEWSCPPKKISPRNKVKVTKMPVDLITLTEGDLFDINEIVHKVANDVLQEMRME